MRQSKLLLLFIVLLSMTSYKSFAYDIAVENADGVRIYYYWNQEKTELTVAESYVSYYSGNIVIPSSVLYEGKNYPVTYIGSYAFNGCKGLSSIKIPNSVTVIGNNAFYGCTGLSSIEIPNSVTSIGSDAFYGCTGLSSIEIPNNNNLQVLPEGIFDKTKWLENQPNGLVYLSNWLYCYKGEMPQGTELEVKEGIIGTTDQIFSGFANLKSIKFPKSLTKLGNSPFRGCSSLTSICVENGNSRYDSRNNCNAIIETENNTLLVGCQSTNIPNSVTSIGSNAFYGCTGLSSIEIPNSVTSIGHNAFYGCTGLSSIEIPNSVTSIGICAFYDCTGLTSFTIPNSITSISNFAFSGCTGLTSFTIPNSITSIGRYAFTRCNNLTTVTIGSSVVSIGERVFKYCKKLRSVRSYIKEPFSLKNEVFEDEIYRECILYIPKGTESLYSRFDGWREFLHIVEMSGEDEPDIPGIEKCATPIIKYENGKLLFECSTEGAVCSSTITDSDITSYTSKEVILTATYIINVYATKEGLNKSDVATAILCWIDSDPKTEGITNSVTNVRAKPVLIQSNGNILSIQGAEEGEYINVYNASGNNVGSAFVSSDVTDISTSLNSGDIGIVKIGEKSIKVVIK